MFNCTDVIFILDIPVIFCSAIKTEFEIIDSRKQLACRYLKSWFMLDFLSVFPFEIVTALLAEEGSEDSSSANTFVRLARIQKLQKFSKMTKLIRMFKFLKSNTSIARKVEFHVKNGHSVDRMIFFIVLVCLFCHLFGCIWIFFGKQMADTEDEVKTWLMSNDL